MPHSFTLQYRDGSSEDVMTDAVDAADQINRTFGLNSVEDATAFGVGVIDNGEVEAPEPEPEDLTGTIVGFSPADPTVVVVDEEDRAILASKMPVTITLQALSGNETAMQYIDGQIVEVLSVGPEVTLGIDMTDQDTDELTADYVINVAEPAVAAPPVVHEDPRFTAPQTPNNPFA